LFVLVESHADPENIAMRKSESRPTRTHWRSVVLTTLLATTLATCARPTPAHAAPSASPRFDISPITHLPGLALGPNDTIESFDLAVDDSAIHLAINPVVNTRYEHREQLWYWRLPGSGAPQTTPVLLVKDRVFAPRIRVDGEAIRIAYSSADSLRLLTSLDGGVHWVGRALGAIPGGGDVALAWVAASGDTVELACAAARATAMVGVDPTSDGPGERAARNQQGLYLFVSKSPGSPRWIQAISSPTESLPLEPIVSYACPGTASVIWLSREYGFEPWNKSIPRSLTVGARLYRVDLASGRSQELKDRAVRRYGGRVIPGFGSVNAMAIADGRGGASFLYDAAEFRSARLACGDSTFVSGPLPGLQSSRLSGSPQSIVTVPSGGKTSVVWIDCRNRGNPYRNLDEQGKIAALVSDVGMWKNDDVYCGVLDDSVPGSPLMLGETEITSPGGHAQILRAEAQGDSIVVVWAGRQRVGPTLDSHGATDLLFLTRIRLRP
jgi:hypothetical protein